MLYYPKIASDILQRTFENVESTPQVSRPNESDKSKILNSFKQRPLFPRSGQAPLHSPGMRSPNHSNALSTHSNASKASERSPTALAIYRSVNWGRKFIESTSSDFSMEICMFVLTSCNFRLICRRRRNSIPLKILTIFHQKILHNLLKFPRHRATLGVALGYTK